MNRLLRYMHARRALHRFAPVIVLALVYACAGTVLRVVLWWRFGQPSDVTAWNLAWILPAGIANDLIQSAYLLLPLALYILLLPDRWYRSRLARAALALGTAVTLGALTFMCFVEARTT